MSLPSLETTPIPGLLVVRLDRRDDARGFFKENWQREKMLAIGLPDFGPVQNNVSFNTDRGVTRGYHTEPWDKFVSLATGRIFGSWVDMREGPDFGTSFHLEMDTAVAVFVPRGVGNSYQTLEDGTAYTYLVNDHWRPGVTYPALNLADETIATPWPIPLEQVQHLISEKDLSTPRLAEVTPMRPKRTLILGAGGQLGQALAAEFPDAHAVTRAELDITSAAAVAGWPWHEYAVILNAAAHTAVDAAETDRAQAWAANAHAPSYLASAAREHGLILVHYSTDYVFDGTAESHPEDEALSPLGVYGCSKAAGEVAAAGAPRHYLLRTSWVIGEGNNFVRTMASLAERGISPTVVSDQIGRLTFTDELARATRHLLTAEASYGTYNVTNSGPATSWCDIAKSVFELSGRSAADVTPVTAEEYGAGKALAPRPANSMLPLDKLAATGFTSTEAGERLRTYLA